MSTTEPEELNDDTILQNGTEQALELSSAFEDLLVYLKQARGFDFSGYKRAGLMRRVAKRMQMVDIGDFTSYIDYLEVHPEEMAQLLNIILINVTSFFRDPAAWIQLSAEIIPRIVESKGRSEAIRIWTAGCASGQEAYTLAMVLADVMGVSAVRDHVKIYATDIDDEALSQARQAVYADREVASVPSAMLEKYFERQSGAYTFHRDLRRVLIFGRHDLMQDAPISRIDLLSCRNTLMYFNAEAQARILARLHFALRENGMLFLGKAEMLFTHASFFVPVDLKHRLFAKVQKNATRERLMLLTQNGSEEETREMANIIRLREFVFESGLVAQIAVDTVGHLVLSNARARNLFRLSERDVGRSLQDLDLSYRPTDLRSMIDQAYTEQRNVVKREVRWTIRPNETIYLDITVTPVSDAGTVLQGAAITFTEVSALKQLQDELDASNHELEAAYAEMQSANEELETTNEELQSANEELETTNEELQSTNEELETTNEELQSTNEELLAMNEEVREHETQLNETSAFFGSILSSMSDGVLVMDENLIIKIWNRKCEDLWGLQSAEVLGRQFVLLDIGLPIDQLRQVIRDCLTDKAGERQTTIASRNRRGQEFNCRVTCTPFYGTAGQIQGIIMVQEAIALV